MAIYGSYCDKPEDVKWLKETHLKGTKYDFKSFVMQGNEDAPVRIFLFDNDNPKVCEAPMACYVTDSDMNLVEIPVKMAL